MNTHVCINPTKQNSEFVALLVLPNKVCGAVVFGGDSLESLTF